MTRKESRLALISSAYPICTLCTTDINNSFDLIIFSGIYFLMHKGNSKSLFYTLCWCLGKDLRVPQLPHFHSLDHLSHMLQSQWLGLLQLTWGHLDPHNELLSGPIGDALELPHKGAHWLCCAMTPCMGAVHKLHSFHSTENTAHKFRSEMAPFSETWFSYETIFQHFWYL